MSVLAIVLRALLPLFLLILLGSVLKRLRVLHVAHVPVLNSLVINVTLPALIFLALTRAPSLPAAYVRLPVALWIAEAATFALAFVLGALLRLPRPTRGALLLTGVFGNTAFLGYPITLSLMPRLFPATVLLDEFGCVIVLYLCAAVVGGFFGAHGGDWRSSLLRFLRSPLFLSVAIGLASRLVPWPAALKTDSAIGWGGGVLAQCLSYLSLGTTPLILLAVGVSLHPEAALKSPLAALLPCILKLGVCPVVMWTVCRWFGFHGEILRVGILQASVPTSVLASVLCAQNELEGPLAVGVVFLSTVLSVVTLPLMLSWLR